MIGNDIIDIKQTKQTTNWERKGFVQKIFNKEEQKVIQLSPSPFITVWRMWSMKESVYKLHFQKTKKRLFSPAKINCTLLSSKKGYVYIDGFRINTTTVIHSAYIFTHTSLDDKEDIISSIFHTPKKDIFSQSKHTYQSIINYISQEKGLEKEQLKIIKNITQIPILCYKGQNLSIPFSLSHHGNYGVFSILNKK